MIRTLSQSSSSSNEAKGQTSATFLHPGLTGYCIHVTIMFCLLMARNITFATILHALLFSWDLAFTFSRHFYSLQLYVPQVPITLGGKMLRLSWSYSCRRICDTCLSLASCGIERKHRLIRNPLRTDIPLSLRHLPSVHCRRQCYVSKHISFDVNMSQDTFAFERWMHTYICLH